MSYLLNQIDNNRSDDEDEHINRLFPKCKPKGSSLSLSPSLQHISHESTSISSTSASDLCLSNSNTNSFTTNENQLLNANFIRFDSAPNSQYSTRRHSANSNYSKEVLSLQQNLWNSSEEDYKFESTFSPIEHLHLQEQEELIYENNNGDKIQSFINGVGGTGSSGSGNPFLNESKRLSPTTIHPKSNKSQSKKCENHNFHSKNSSTKPSKCDKKKVLVENEILTAQSPHISNSNCANKSRNYISSSSSSSNSQQQEEQLQQQQQQEGVVLEQNFHSVISSHSHHRTTNVSALYTSNIKSAAGKILQPLSSSSESHLLKMDHNPIEDNFDNGIGSGCSRSSGESSHSNTSDFMDSLVSPMTASRASSRVPQPCNSITTSGIKGHTSSAGIPPAMGNLRDSRIEIAGGREIYSQNRIRASRRHRGSSHSISTNEIMTESIQSTNNVSSNKIRKKSHHSHLPYQQHHHCCHTPTCCATSSNSCGEVSLPPGSLVWEPNHGCTNRRTTELGNNRQHYLSHSHSLGGGGGGGGGGVGVGVGGAGQCVKCTGGCGCCGHHSFDFPETSNSEFEGNRMCRNVPKLHGTSPNSPMTVRETVFAAEVRSIEKSIPRTQSRSHVPENKGGVLHCELGSPCQLEPVIYESVVAEDGKVVFDDIGEWRGRQVDDSDNPIECGYDGGDEHDISESQAIKRRQQSQQSSSTSRKEIDESSIGVGGAKSKRLTGFITNNIDAMESSPCTSNKDGNTTPSGYESDECSASACTNTSIISNLKTSPNFGNKRLIGNIPIAEYEGSPKRYGLKQSAHPVTTHFDLVDMDIAGHNVDEHNSPVINHESNAQNLIDHTATAATSSSSSSLDNTNTNVSSNSSSRTNNRISPRALSPSQPLSTFSTRFPGFPQRVSAAPLSNSNRQENTPVNNTCHGELNDSSCNPEVLSCTPASKSNSELQANNLSKDSLTSCLASDSEPEQLIHIEELDSTLHGGDVSNQTNSTEHVGASSSSLCNTSSATIMGASGFLLSSNEIHSPSTESRNQDLLYEFSETRKVLEEFFNISGHPNSSGGGGGGDGVGCGQFRADKTNFDELDYMLKRQAGNSYVGQRLACDVPGNSVSEDSPKKPPRRGVLLLGSSDGDGSDEKGSPKLISFQEISLPQMHSSQQQQKLLQFQSQSLVASSARSPRSLKSHSRSQSQSPPLHDLTRDINDNDIDAETTSTNTETDLGETEVGIQGEAVRNFPLSPETTDCDSNELESELSLEYEGSLQSCRTIPGASRVVVPLEADCLSSGNESENEEIIEVDVGFRDDECYLMSGKTKLCSSQFTRQIPIEAEKGIKDSIVSSTLIGIVDDNNKPLSYCGGGGSESAVNNILTWTPVKNLSFATEDNRCKIGNNSNTDPNPTLMLMKKQISEIEKEIQLRASQQCQKSQSSAAMSSSAEVGILVETEIDSSAVSVPSKNVSAELSPSNSLGTVSQGCRINGKHAACDDNNPFYSTDMGDTQGSDANLSNHDPELDALDPMRPTPPPSPAPGSILRQKNHNIPQIGTLWKCTPDNGSNVGSHSSNEITFDRLVDNRSEGLTNENSNSCGSLSTNTVPPASVAAAIQDIKEAIQRAKPLPQQRQSSLTSCNSQIIPSSSSSLNNGQHSRGFNESQIHQSQERSSSLICDSSPVWVPRKSNRADHRLDSSEAKDPLLKKQRYEDTADDDDDADTDAETDRLLGATRTEDDCGFYDEKDWKKAKSRSLLPSLNKGVAFVKSAASGSVGSSQGALLSTSASSLNNTISNSNTNHNSSTLPINSTSNTFNSSSVSSSIINNSFSNTNNGSCTAVSSTSSSQQHLMHSLSPSTSFEDSQVQLASSTGSSKSKKQHQQQQQQEKDGGGKKKRSKEDFLKNPTVLIEGVLFRARYLGSTQLVCEGQPTKATRMMQAEEAVSRIKAPSNLNGTNELTQGPSSSSIASTSVTSLLQSPTNNDSSSEDVLKSSTMSKNIIDNHHHGIDTCTSSELDEYFYVGEEDDDEEEEETCESEGDDLDLFVKTHQSMGSNSSLMLRDNKGLGLTFEDIHGSSNALQIHDNHTHPLSLHHNRASTAVTTTTTTPNSNGESGSSGSSGSINTQPSSGFLNLSPPSGTALPGTMFRLRFIGSLEVDEEIGTGKRRRKRPKKTMVEEAIMKMKSMAPEGEAQPSTEVDLFISTEKIMVLNTDLKEIMMDHALRTISYIADIGDLVVLMARRRPVPTDPVDDSKPPRPPKMICHVFESDEAQYIAQSIGQAFQVAYMEFLKANGIEDSSFVREMDYQEVLNSQEIFGDELQMFAKKELQKEVVVPKAKGEILGVVIVESGWGSMLPTVVIANLAPAGAAARCGQLNIGDQIIAINGVSLVGLPLSTCQTYIKNTKTQTVVKLTVVPCPPVVEVKIKRPDTKYQLGFSVQNGVICSLLRGGIAERGGVRVGHRIIEINSQSVVAVPHEKIVNLLATSVGEINMKTMPTSMFRLLTGQETPLYI